MCLSLWGKHLQNLIQSIESSLGPMSCHLRFCQPQHDHLTIRAALLSSWMQAHHYNLRLISRSGSTPWVKYHIYVYLSLKKLGTKGKDQSITGNKQITY